MTLSEPITIRREWYLELVRKAQAWDDIAALVCGMDDLLNGRVTPHEQVKAEFGKPKPRAKRGGRKA